MVDYEDLPVVSDVEEAAAGGPVIHDGSATTSLIKLTSGEGDIDAAFAAADRTVKQRILHKRLAPIAMEPRGVLARYFPGEEELTLWSSTQIPHLMRTQVALMIGMPENKLRVITPEVGGGFGSKLNVYAEEALLGWISMQLGKPVKWIETRRENMQATIHGRGQVGDVEVAFKNDGTLLGLRYSVFADLGCLSSTAHTGDSHADRAHAFRRLQDSRDSDEHHRRLHKQDGHRCLSRRRTP